MRNISTPRAEVFERIRRGWTDGVAAFDARFPDIESFVRRFGEDALGDYRGNDDPKPEKPEGADPREGFLMLDAAFGRVDFSVFDDYDTHGVRQRVSEPIGTIAAVEEFEALRKLNKRSRAQQRRVKHLERHLDIGEVVCNCYEERRTDIRDS